MTDRYTKAVLTVIAAAALTGLAAVPAVACPYADGCIGGNRPDYSAPYNYNQQDYSFSREVDSWNQRREPEPDYLYRRDPPPPTMLELFDRPANDPFDSLYD